MLDRDRRFICPLRRSFCISWWGRHGLILRMLKPLGVARTLTDSPWPKWSGRQMLGAQNLRHWPATRTWMVAPDSSWATPIHSAWGRHSYADRKLGAGSSGLTGHPDVMGWRAAW